MGNGDVLLEDHGEEREASGRAREGLERKGGRSGRGAKGGRGARPWKARASSLPSSTNLESEEHTYKLMSDESSRDLAFGVRRGRKGEGESREEGGSWGFKGEGEFEL